MIRSRGGLGGWGGPWVVLGIGEVHGWFGGLGDYNIINWSSLNLSQVTFLHVWSCYKSPCLAHAHTYRSPMAYSHHHHHRHTAIQGATSHRGHLSRAQRQPPSLDFTAELFGLSISSAPIRLATRKRVSAPNLKHDLSSDLVVNAESVGLAARHSEQQHPAGHGHGHRHGIGKRHLGFVSNYSQYN